MNRKRLKPNGNGEMNDSDFIGEGFHKIDERLLVNRPPKIQWGKRYEAWPIERQLDYTQKLAASMNHAAHLIQLQRDELNTLCGLKEQQLEKMTKALDANNNMIQQQMTEMNEHKQAANKHAAAQNKLIKELRDGNSS